MTDLELERNAPYTPTPDNRPRSLRESPLPLTRDDDTQMSFGERAAVEGVLAQLRPDVAIEIGTAEGGSLRRIAAYSGEVHSIDVAHVPLGSPSQVPPNVTLHTGRSAERLPALLEALGAAGRGADFVLVDGDHSSEGVAGDLSALLASPVTRRTAILVHDTMNAEVRAGVESVGFDDHERVLYWDLDFVTGYVYREGAARGTAWGGLGLVVTGSGTPRPRGLSGRETLYADPFAAIQGLREGLNRP